MKPKPPVYKIAKIGLLFLCLAISDGCVVQKGHHVELRGNCVATEPDHVANLSALTGALPQESNADTLVLKIVGTDRQAIINSIHGSYRYETNSVQPLKIFNRHLDLIKNLQAIKPAEDFILFTPTPDPEHLKGGRYQFNFEYTLNLNDKTNSCSFDVHVTTKRNVKWFLEYFMDWAMKGAG